MNADQPQHEDEISLIDLWIKAQEWWAYLWKRKSWIIGIAFLFSIGGYLNVKLARPVYSATLTFSLEQGDSKSSISGLASQFGFSMGSGGGTFMGDNLLNIMKSRMNTRSSATGTTICSRFVADSSCSKVPPQSIQ